MNEYFYENYKTSEDYLKHLEDLIEEIHEKAYFETEYNINKEI